MKSAPQIQPARPGVLATAIPRPTLRPSAPALRLVEGAATAATELEIAPDTQGLPELRAIRAALDTEPTLSAAALRLQRSLGKLMRLDEAHCVWIDWPYRTTQTIGGPIEDPLEELVLQAAGSGRRSMVDEILIEPLGRAPARAALVLRKPRRTRFSKAELQFAAALASSVAPRIDRLIAENRAVTGW